MSPMLLSWGHPISPKCDQIPLQPGYPRGNKSKGDSKTVVNLQE
ncbi:hypothetical protein C5167_014529 [Papaver somniferum]|uniref:Uncharacterized protein n=1 Tax=Papaver somniferum TaxID=3469 RepID=A0A4Y7J7D2_PAPSO|nr:hypothetical protein C5167_014529 [Papaver somniferum]